MQTRAVKKRTLYLQLSFEHKYEIGIKLMSTIKFPIFRLCYNCVIVQIFVQLFFLLIQTCINFHLKLLVMPRKEF